MCPRTSGRLPDPGAGPPATMAVARAAETFPASPLRVSPALCLTVRGGGGAAARCTRLCPAGAIVVEPPEGRRPGPRVEAGRCDGCGLCAGACPTGALEAASGAGARDPGAGLAAAVRAATRPGEDLWLRCKRSPEAAGDHRLGTAPAAVEVPCLGALAEAVLLEAVAGGAGAVRLDDRACGGCSRRKGMALARLTVRRARRLASLFGHSTPIRFSHVPGSSRRGALRSRRSFLFLDASPQRLPAEPAVLPDLRRTPADRRLLAAALSRLGEPAACVLPAGAASLWAVFASPACDGCGACAALCPTEALELREDAAGATLLHRPLWCTGCGACIDRCPREALAPRDPVPSSFLAAGRVALATARRRSCAACGRPVDAGSSGELCPDCRVRRALAASFAAHPRGVA